MGPLFAAAERYWQTLRHLRPIQFYGRLRFRLARPTADISPPPARRRLEKSWRSPARRRPSLSGKMTFSLLNQTASLPEVGWDGPQCDKLWRYNQHYFDDLNACDADARIAWHIDLLLAWVEENPPGEGTGWEPYPTSLRIVNWIKWALAGNALPTECIQSLAVQVRWLMRRLEWHLLANHLFANAKALVFAGLYFEGSEAHRWLDMGMKILAHELPEQILPDGGQFELSPMYHALAIEDVLDVVNIMRAYTAALGPVHEQCLAQCEGRLPAMRRWLNTMCHPDGEIAFFNDAACGVAPSSAELDDYARRLGYGAALELQEYMWLADSGYARLAQGGAVLIVDMARVGPDYLPGHAHADTLSFEFSFQGQRIFVNSGTSIYGAGPERLRQRGTPAHNTVTVNGRNSSDVWSGFRVGRRAYPMNAGISSKAGALFAHAGHDGYRHLPGCPVHQRSWALSSNRMIVEDSISVSSLPGEARFHLHPDVRVQQVGPGDGTLTAREGRLLYWNTHGCPAQVESTSWHPEFGISQPNYCIVVALREGRATFELSWI
ncbi:alginate lyase family protein [Emcibacter sp. SYSU 3D8]|uniref:heparinase II/III family protein n=1 Tax=Emcibacter sp. SYSU 3D8 TaxID=3133969 RepID=UPI0031FE7997